MDAGRFLKNNKWFVLLLASAAAVIWATKGLAVATSLLF